MMNRNQSYLDAVRIYQHSRRDENLGYGYPEKDMSSVHGAQGKRFWILRDNHGFLAAVTVGKNGKVL